MIKIQSINNDNITKENLHEQSLVTLVLESNDPTTLFMNPEVAEKARAIFSDSAINSKIIEITKKLESLSSEYSDETITEVFKEIIGADQQLYIDIISAAYYIAIKFSDMKYVEFMHNMHDIINEESGITITDAPDKNPDLEENREEAPIVDEDEDIK